jgi:hypothetical protein
MKETASRGSWEYTKCIRGQPTSGGPPASALGEGEITPDSKKKITNCYTGPRTWADTLERSKRKKMDTRF